MAIRRIGTTEGLKDLYGVHVLPIISLATRIGAAPQPPTIWPGRLRVPFYFRPFFFVRPAAAAAAFLAISVRCAGEGFAARALPL